MGEKQFTQAKTAAFPVRRTRDAVAWNRTATGRIIGLIFVLLVATDAAFADFLVQPMILHLPVSPGKRYTREMKMENADPKEGETVSLRLAELTQKSDGTWTELQPTDPNIGKFTVRSCSSWLTLPPEEIKVGPYQIVPFTLQIDVPAATRGYYFAALVATTAPRLMTTATGTVAPMNMQIVVPVILEVQSSPMRQDIALTDVGLKYEPAALNLDGTTKPAANNLVLNVTNNGGTFSSLLPVMRLWAEQSGGHWRMLGEMRFSEYLIMPGAKLSLSRNAGLQLPSGKYQMEGCLYLDGRRGPVLRKEVQFAGDPTLAQTVQGRVALAVTPSPLFIEALPGATRSTGLQITNGAEEEIKVTTELILPEHMESAVVKSLGVQGDALSCANWVTVNPKEFTVKGHMRRSVGLMAKMPKEASQYRTYYGKLRFHISYMDGKPAGTKDALVCVENKKVPENPVVQDNVLTVYEVSPSRYQASASFVNVGANYVDKLTCMGVLSIVGAGGGGAAIFKRFLMTSEALGQTGILLPIEVRTFAGTLDLTDVPPQDYYVTAILQYPGAPAGGVQRQIAIQVSEQGGRKYALMKEVTGTTGPQVIKL